MGTTSPHPVSTVHRDRLLLRPALSVQEEECEAHRGGDAAGGPARYEQMESVLLIQPFSLPTGCFVAWPPTMAPCSPYHFS